MLLASTLAGPVLLRPTSATGVTLVNTGELVLFAKFASTVVEVKVATLVNEPEAGAFTVRARLVIWLLARVPRVQFTTPLLFKPPPVALTKVTVAGRLSVTTTPLALEGPKLVTDMV